LVTFAPDDIDWEDEIRLATEERASFSPDALTGLQANYRFAGPETMETKIPGRLTVWQNWIFNRPSAAGQDGALRRYGTGQLPHIAFNRKVGAFSGIEASPDGEMLSADEWQRRQSQWLPTDVDKTFVRSLMQPVHERGKIAAWIAPPRNGVNGKPFDYEYVHLA
jgi:hypothetical protein